MNIHQDSKHQCGQNTSLYIRKLEQSKHCDIPQKPICEKPKIVTETAPKLFKCCLISAPIIPTSPKCNPYENIKCPDTRFCARVNNQCDNLYLTTYAKEFSSETGKLIKKCLCVKFNGLQDTCQHNDCSTKIRCLDNPFPNCKPARKWKNDLICKEKNQINNCQK